MKRTFVCVIILTALNAWPASGGQVSLGVSISDGKLMEFDLAVGDHYRVGPQVVLDYRTRYKLHDEEMPVVFFLAARAHVGPQAVIDLRLAKRSWFDIALHFGLSPEVFFVPVRVEKIGPPYGNAYGYYRKYGYAGDWRKVALADREVVDLVNLRFLSEHHGTDPETIMAMRGKGESFARIHGDLGKGKSAAGPAASGDKGKGQKPKGNKKKGP